MGANSSNEGPDTRFINRQGPSLRNNVSSVMHNDPTRQSNPFMPGARLDQQPMARPVQQPAARPVQQAAARPVQQPVARPVQQPAARLVQQAAARPEQPTARPVQQPAARPVQQAAARPVQQPVARPVQQPTARPLQQPVARPVQHQMSGAVPPLMPGPFQQPETGTPANNTGHRGRSSSAGPGRYNWRNNRGGQNRRDHSERREDADGGEGTWNNNYRNNPNRGRGGQQRGNTRPQGNQQHENQPHHAGRGRRYEARHMGFRLLEEISKLDSLEALMRMSNNKTALQELLQNEIQPDFHSLLMKILSNISQSTFNESKAHVLIEVCNSNYIPSLQHYLMNLPYNTDTDKNRNRLYWSEPGEFWGNLLVFCETIVVLSPSTAVQRCRALAEATAAACLDGLRARHGYAAPPDVATRLQRLAQMFTECEKKVEEEKKTRGDPRLYITQDESRPPPENFRELPVLPTANDLQGEMPYVRPNIVAGGYESLDHYLDVQFRLLREDCYGPLREGIRQYKRDNSKRRFDNIRVHKEVIILEPYQNKSKVGILVQFEEKKDEKNKKKKHRRMNWAHSKRFMFGALLLLTNDNCQSFILATVLDRDLKTLEEGLLPIEICNCDAKSVMGLFGRKFIMIESEVYFEPYFHVLKALQDPQFPEHLAMKNYIVDVQPGTNPPAYLSEATSYSVKSNDDGLPMKHTFRPLDESSWPQAEELGLDATQYAAYNLALTHEFSVIQGPPGTGKTYLGVLVARTLLTNLQVKGGITMLVICYTNHALDQFLEAILDVTESVVRIGGQSKSERMNKYNLSKVRYTRAERNSAVNNFFYEKRDEVTLSTKELYSLQKKLSVVNNGVVNFAFLRGYVDDVERIRSYRGQVDDPVSAWLFEGVEQLYGAEAAPDEEQERDLGQVDDDGRDELILDDEVDYDTDEVTVNNLFDLEDVRNNIRKWIGLLPRCRTREESYNFQAQINYSRAKIRCFTEQRRRQFDNHDINIRNKPHPSRFTHQERWAIYFSWMQVIRKELVPKIAKLQAKQRVSSDAYEEARLMLDRKLLKDTRVVGMTTTGAARLQKLIRSLAPPIVIVEEAAEVLETHIVVSLTKHCQHLILIDSSVCWLHYKHYIMDISLFERMITNGHHSRRLGVQHRMRPAIASLIVLSLPTGDHHQLRPSAAHYKLAKHYNMEISLFERMITNGHHSRRLGVQHRMRPAIASLIVLSLPTDDHQQLRPSAAHYKLAKHYNMEISLFERMITNGHHSRRLGVQHRMRPAIASLIVLSLPTGDHQQLRPSAAHYKLAKHYNMEISLFERMITNGHNSRRLGVQHRMRPAIASLIVLSLPTGDHQQLRPSAAHYKLAKHYNMEISLFERMITNGHHSRRLGVQHRMRPAIASLIVLSLPTGDHQQLRPSAAHYKLAKHYNMEISLFERMITNGHHSRRLGVQHRMRPAIASLIVLSLPTGDHQQLRPSAAHYKLAKHYNMEISLFERMITNGHHSRRLGVQHRMRPTIASLIVPAIYPELQNHASVENFPNVRGLTANLFFISHDNAEDAVDDSASRKNQFEADLTLGLANYIMQQGYEPEDVTILAAYSGQMFYMRKERDHYYYLKDVKITVVDNYQGEESKIILLSLVRNNSEGNIGFLGTANRVCVALSRAREGFYILGNMDMLKKATELWGTISRRLEEQQALGTSITLRCENHPEQITEVQSVADFKKVPEGGCMLKCDVNLRCSHPCPLICHAYDRSHLDVKCPLKCERVICELGHVCPLRCVAECAPCEVRVRKRRPCGHEQAVPCHRDPNDPQLKCLTVVDVILPPCGHKATKACFVNIENVPCPEQCVFRLPCGHSCVNLCHKTKDPDHLRYLCEKPCGNAKKGCTAGLEGGALGDHACAKKCYEPCNSCNIEVMKKRSGCGHRERVECSVDVDSKPCQKNCKRMLTCGHHCRSKCHEPCGNCQQKVKKVLPSCGHEVEVLCKDEPQAKDCWARCERKLPCGHKCKLTCNVPCDPAKCKEIVPRAYHSPCGHKVNLPCNELGKGLLGEAALLRACREPCGAMLACEHPCAGSCGECRQGRLHVPCAQPCGRTLLCGHDCMEPCKEVCPPCRKPCEVRCVHTRCGLLCGEPCPPCKEKCTSECPHGRCERNCSDECSRPPCDEPCPKLLPCGDRCRGLCGEPCPEVCRDCDPDNFPTDLLGDPYDDDAKLIQLQDCSAKPGHFLEVEDMDNLMNGDRETIMIRSCPFCRTHIITTDRYKNQVNSTFRKEINPIKIKIYGDKAEIARQRNTLYLKSEEMFETYNATSKDHVLWGKGLLAISKELRNKMVKMSLLQVNMRAVGLDVLERLGENYQMWLQKAGGELQDEMKSLMEMLLAVVTARASKISAQQQRDVERELQRMRATVQLARIAASEQYKSARGTPAVREAGQRASLLVLSWEPFRADDARGALEALQEAVSLSGIVTQEERTAIVRAMGLSQGHWYKCPKGHIYCIGECGGAMQTSRCPECGAAIGGSSHRLLADNALAPEMDGARHPAWGDVANNMANWQI